MLPNGWCGGILARPGSRCAPDVGLLQAWDGQHEQLECRPQGSRCAEWQAGCGPGRGNREGEILTWNKKENVSPSLVGNPQSNCERLMGSSSRARRIKSVLGCCTCCTGDTGKGLGLSQGEFSAAFQLALQAAR